MLGVALTHPTSLGALIELHGGVLDEALEAQRTTLVIHRIGPSDRAGSFELAPILHSRGARLARLARHVLGAPVLLVAASIAGEVEVSRRWIHPRADRVLATLLRSETEHDFSRDFVLTSSGARVGRDVVVPPGVHLGPNAVVYPGVQLGRDVVIGAGTIVGREGFGFVDRAEGAEGEEPLRIPHRAGVVLADGVELGPLCTVDAGILAPTSIGAHTKIDAQVHVGHGVVIGAGCRIAAQVGFAGSVVVEDDVRIGGQAGIADHVRIGRSARIAAKAGVIGDVPAGAVFAGYPAVARARWLRGQARLYRR